MDTASLLDGYDLESLTIGSLGGHSALDVSHGAKRFDLRSLVVAQKGREKTYERHKFRDPDTHWQRGCIDELIVVDTFQDVLKKDVQQKLRKQNTLFVHNRYFWVYFDDFAKVENEFLVPILGSRHLLKLEERDQPYNQYHLLQDAGIRIPKIFASGKEIDRPVLVKAHEAHRDYERAFFVVSDPQQYEAVGSQMEEEGKITKDWRTATIEEFIVGAAVNFNFFYSPLTKELELLGTDTRRQTNLDGFLRMIVPHQAQALGHVPLKMIETGHVAVTVKESLLEKAYDLGEKFVKATQNLPKKLDPAGKGIIGPFALQGAVVAEEGKEDIVIFDVSLRIPGSPGIRSTPYGAYLYGEPISMGERIALEVRRAVEEKRLQEIIT